MFKDAPPFLFPMQKQTPNPGVCSQQDPVLYAFEHLQYSISGFAPKEQNRANVVSILWRVFIIGGHSKLQAS
ncbi:MAG: hypothetical protein ACLS3C_16305 [Oscillospiraceae bacterium]